jgi:Integrase core domain
VPKATAPNQLWVADITYVETQEGWLFLAAILDLYSRKIVGWGMSERIDTALVLKALGMALRHRQPPAKLLLHSDRGVQYASGDYRQALKAAGLVASMSRKGNGYDNATMEREPIKFKGWTSLCHKLVLPHHFTCEFWLEFVLAKTSQCASTQITVPCGMIPFFGMTTMPSRMK